MAKTAAAVVEAPAVKTASEVRDALLARFPASEYVACYEAATGADRQGRKLDALYISTWRSRGHELDGVEIKEAWFRARDTFLACAESLWTAGGHSDG